MLVVGLGALAEDAMRPIRNVRPGRFSTTSALIIAASVTLAAQSPRPFLEPGPGVLWSTYIGASGEDQAFGGYWGGQMRRGPDGTITTWMITTSPELSSRGAGTLGSETGEHDLVCARFSADGRRMLWRTSIGGPGDELGGSIAVAPDGDVFVGGHTFGGLPTTPGAHQSEYAGGNGDGFLARLGGDGRIKWLTYVGGAGADEIIGVALDPAGNLNVTLGTTSDGLATPGAYSTTRSGDLVAQFSPDGDLRWATYSGGADLFGAICADRDGDVLVTGSASSPEFLATRCASSPSRRGTDAVVLRFSSVGDVRWATCIGGSGIDWAGGVAIAPGGAIMIAGTTLSPDLPATASAFQRRYAGGGWDGFVARLSAVGELQWLTYVGGTGEDWLGGLAVDGAGHATIVGRTSSPDLRITAHAVQPALRGDYDGLVLRFDSTGRMLWSSYLGGLMPVDAYERIVALELDRSSVLLYGSTSCIDFPTTPGTVQPIYGGGRRDCFLARLCLLTPTVTAATTVLCAGDSTVLCAPDGLAVRWSTGAITSSIVVRDSGRYWFEATDGSCSGWSDTVTVRLVSAPALTVTPAGPVALCDGEPLELDAGVHHAYEWSTGAVTRRIVVSTPGRYWVRVSDGGECSSTTHVDVLPAQTRVAFTRAPSVVCAGDTLALELPEGFVRYRWSTGATSRGVLVVGGETLWAELIDSAGCRRYSDTIQIGRSVPPPLVIDGPAHVVCAGDTVVLTASPRASYRWSTGAATRSVAVWTSGVYEVETTDEHGCRQRAVFDLLVRPAPAPRLSLRGAIALCEGDTVAVSIDQEYAVVAWSDGVQGRHRWVSAAGIYFARVVDGAGCTAWSDTLLVAVHRRPEAMIAGPSIVCATESVPFEVVQQPSVVFTWHVPQGTFTGDSVGQRVYIRWTRPGPADVVVTAHDTSTGCVRSVTHRLRVDAGPLLRPYALGPTRICSGDSVVLDAGASYEVVLWSTGERTRRIVVRLPGRYTVTAGSSGGCVGVSDPIVVSVVSGTIPTVSAVGDTLVCSEAHAYQWLRNGVPIEGAIGRRMLPPRNGEYVVRALDSSGCWTMSAVCSVRFAARAVVVIPDLSARPGEILRIPLIVASAINLPQVEAGACRATLRFRSRLLLPLDDSLHGAIDGTDRVVMIHGAYHAGDSVLAELVVTAALADTSGTIIRLEDLVWENAEVATTLVDGRFRIRPHGGWSALIDNGLLSLGAPTPNPARDVVEIGYTLIEDGYARLVLYDALGRAISVLLDAYQVPGTFRLTHSLAGRAAGAYRFELTTPSGRVGQTVWVVR